jgi:hypothetical protein
VTAAAAALPLHRPSLVLSGQQLAQTLTPAGCQWTHHLEHLQPLLLWLQAALAAQWRPQLLLLLHQRLWQQLLLLVVVLRQRTV